jgi:hypothetical protein
MFSFDLLANYLLKSSRKKPLICKSFLENTAASGYLLTGDVFFSSAR